MQPVIAEESVHARVPRGFATDPFPQNIIYDGMKIPKVINTKITNHNLKKKKRGKNVINHLGIKVTIIRSLLLTSEDTH